jgi:hypothetical protein
MEKIELRKVRDFGSLFNDSISFLKINFKSYFGINMFLAGPFVLLTGLLMGYVQFMTAAMNKAKALGVGNSFAMSSITTAVLFVLILLLTTLVSNACVSLYFKLYDKSAPEQLPLKRHQIAPLLASASFRLFYNLLLFCLLLGVIALVLFGLVAMLYKGSGGFQIALIILLVIAYIVVAPVVFYIITISQFLVVRDEILITAAIQKAFAYLRGNFWWTWLLIISAGISLMMVYFVFQLPYYVILMLSTFTRSGSSFMNYSIWYVLFGAFAMVGTMLVINPIFTCFCVFNFYSQEEKQEGASLLTRIEQMGDN